MKLQDDGYSCGPYAVYNALKALGRDSLDVEEIANAAGTDPKAGTDERGIKAALGAYGYTTTTLQGPGRDTFWEQLTKALTKDPVILVVDDNDHWVTLIGKLGDRVICADPENTKANKRENGVETYSKAELMEYIGDGSMYGLRVVKSSFGGG